jgi:ABC-2 type transport system permease protein
MSVSVGRTFLALCGRDLWVTVRHDPIAFLAQALLQPVFFLFVFGRVLPEIGAAQGAYGTQLLPGVLALTLVLTSLQNTALPLVIEFSFTKEIEDRLLAPLPVWMVGIQKLVIAALRGLVAAVLILPARRADPARRDRPRRRRLARVRRGAARGLDRRRGRRARARHRGPAEPHQHRLRGRADAADLHRRDVLPLGGARLAEVVPDRDAVQPLTYVSEGMRGALTSVPHLGTGWIALGLVGSLVLFGAAGLLGFERRAVD